MSEPTSLGVLLTQHRAAAGLSQEALAERAGLGRRAVSDLERGARRHPTRRRCACCPRELIHIPLTPAERVVVRRTQARATGALDRSVAQAAWSDGGSLSVAQMIELAVGAPTLDEPRMSTVLTVRETAVARLVARGLTNPQIGQTLAIAPRTAQRHVENIRAKLKVHSRAEVAAWAARQNL